MLSPHRVYFILAQGPERRNGCLVLALTGSGKHQRHQGVSCHRGPSMVAGAQVTHTSFPSGPLNQAVYQQELRKLMPQTDQSPLHLLVSESVPFHFR